MLHAYTSVSYANMLISPLEQVFRKKQRILIYLDYIYYDLFPTSVFFWQDIRSPFT